MAGSLSNTECIIRDLSSAVPHQEHEDECVMAVADVARTPLPRSMRGWIAFNPHQCERSGQYRSHASSTRWGRPELCGNDEHMVIRGIESHIARPLWGLYIFRRRDIGPERPDGSQ